MSRRSRRGRRILAIMGLVLLIVSLTGLTEWALESKSGDVVVIDTDQVIDDDLYVAARSFTLNGTVKGDLVVAATTIEINGTVEGDLTAAGQSVVVNGTVQDDARIAGYALTIGGQVTNDLIAAGFSLEHKRESKVGGDLVYFGYQSLLAGDVARNVKIFAGAVELAGTVGGNVSVNVGGAEPRTRMPTGFPLYPGLPNMPSVPAGLTVDDGAHIAGNLQYTANAKANIPSGVVAGNTDFTQYVAKARPAAQRTPPRLVARVGNWFVRQLRRLITLLLLGALMMWLVPGWTRNIAGIVQSKPLPSLGWGVVVIAAFVLAMFVLVIVTIILAIVFGLVTLGELAGRFATLGGLVLSAAGFGFSLIWTYVTRIVISLLLGQLIFRLFKSPTAEHRWWPMLLGVLIFVIITAIPVLGWLATLATVLLGLGAVWLWVYERLRSREATPVIAKAM